MLITATILTTSRMMFDLGCIRHTGAFHIAQRGKRLRTCSVVKMMGDASVEAVNKDVSTSNSI